MSLYAELSIDINVYGEATKDTLKNNLKFENKVLDVFNYETSSRVKLAAAASDVAVAFQSVSNGQLILLKSESEFTVKLNGTGSPAYTLKPQTNSQTLVKTPAFLALLGASITSLHLGNSGTAEIFVDVGISGQAVAP